MYLPLSLPSMWVCSCAHICAYMYGAPRSLFSVVLQTLLFFSDRVSCWDLILVNHAKLSLPPQGCDYKCMQSCQAFGSGAEDHNYVLMPAWQVLYWVFLLFSMCSICMPGAHGCQVRALTSLELGANDTNQHIDSGLGQERQALLTTKPSLQHSKVFLNIIFI